MGVLNPNEDDVWTFKNGQWQARPASSIIVGSAIQAFYSKFTTTSTIAITAATSATLNRLHIISGTSADYDITISGLSPSPGDVVGFYVKDYAAASKQFRLDAGGTVKIAGRTRYLTLLHTNVVLLMWDGTDWQPLVLNLDTPWVDAGAMTITASPTNPTKGTVAKDSILWRRSGNSIFCLGYFRQTAAGTAGSGTYQFSIPIGTFNSTLMTVADHSGAGARPTLIGSGQVIDSATEAYDTNVFAYSSAAFGLTSDYSAGTAVQRVVSGTSFPLSTAAVWYSFNLSAPMTDW